MDAFLANFGNLKQMTHFSAVTLKSDLSLEIGKYFSGTKYDLLLAPPRQTFADFQSNHRRWLSSQVMFG